MPEQPVAQIAQEVLADARHHEDRESAEHEPEERHCEIENDGEVERGGVVLAQSGVDAVLHERGPGEQRGRLGDDHGHDDRDADAIRAEHAEQAAQHALGLFAQQRLLRDEIGPVPLAPHDATPRRSVTRERASTSR